MKQNQKKFEISIIIPVYNEEESVLPLSLEIINTLNKLEKNFEIIFVDDGSSDSTYDILKQVKERLKQDEKGFGWMRIIRFSRNFGQTPAMQAGFDYSNGDIIVTMDGDLQNDPSDIPKMIEKLKEGYDVVCGWRKDRKDKRMTRVLPSKIANWIIAEITGIPIHDNGCSLKVYRKSIIKSINLYSDMHRFIPSMTKMIGAKVTEVVVNHRSRKYGKTKYGLARTWKVIFDMITIKMLISFYHRPIFWFVSVGSIFLIIGVLTGIMSLIFLRDPGQSFIYFTSSVLFFFLFAGLFIWGLLSGILCKNREKHQPESKFNV